MAIAATEMLLLPHKALRLPLLANKNFPPRLMHKLKSLFPILLGLTFIFSGIAKLLSIELFELFLYSFKLVSFNVAALAARLFIGLELVLGLSFLMRFKTKAVSYFTLILLFFFTVFLFYLELSNSKEDCHCFGNLLQLSNTWSIIKNLVMAGMTLLVLKYDLPDFKRLGKTLTLGILALGFVATFVVKPPDFVYKKRPSGAAYCEPCIKTFMDEHKLSNQKLVVCFLSPQCKYCKLAAKKISTISQIAGNQTDVVFVFWDNLKGKSDFIQQANASSIRQIMIGTLDFISLTKGEMPLIVLSDKGNIQQAYRYDEVKEQEIIRFLKK